MSQPGQYMQATEGYSAFVPDALLPELYWTAEWRMRCLKPIGRLAVRG